GVRIYNAALVMAEGRRVEVVTTDDREIALAVLRALRKEGRSVCFAAGHGEYDIDNFEFHTHFEGIHGHSHDAQGMAVVQMEQHGIGRFRRAIERLGLAARKVVLATDKRVPEDCAALVEANPRTPWSPPESAALRAYLAGGGSVLMLVEPDYPIEASLASVLAEAGVGVGEGTVVDPESHYFTDQQMVAVGAYAAHPATRGLALSFLPGVRPLDLLSAPEVEAVALARSSGTSRVVADRLKPDIATGATGPRNLAIAAEGRLDGRQGRFRLAMVGDADFASNSFFPYMANADFVLGLLSWILREERLPAMKPPVEVLPTVALTGTDVRDIFIVAVLVPPGLVGLLGALVWWRRRY
ncbi:MAG: hypothetical protein FJX47_15725, partial [Alphaproteobacteria bacterium]|nr:hypothetical protein [Alphaproteobacteria bacterium]